MIVDFLGNYPIVQEIDDDNWRLVAPFTAYVKSDDGTGRTITVPQLFETDFASAPRIPFIFAKFGNRAHRPAVLHDFLYSEGGTEDDRQYADHVLLAACIADGMDSSDAHMIYDAVREFGGSHWKT